MEYITKSSNVSINWVFCWSFYTQLLNSVSQIQLLARRRLQISNLLLSEFKRINFTFIPPKTIKKRWFSVDLRGNRRWLIRLKWLNIRSKVDDDPEKTAFETLPDIHDKVFLRKKFTRRSYVLKKRLQVSVAGFF